MAGHRHGVALFLIVVFDRLPVWFLRGAPAIGTGLVALAIYYSGPGASAPYAMYMAWVVIAASLFLDTRLILAHGVLAIGAYAFVLSTLDSSDGLDALRVTMTAGTVLIVALVMGGISGQLREVLQRLQAAARTDPLTGLLNRRALEEAFETELTRAERAKFGVGLVMLDLDGFKGFNDEYGHPAGDAALERLSHALVDATRAIDHVAQSRRRRVRDPGAGFDDCGHARAGRAPEACGRDRVLWFRRLDGQLRCRVLSGQWF